MKVVLIGSTGFVGKNIAEKLKDKVELISTSRVQESFNYTYFDFTKPSSWDAIVKINPDIIINAAAYGVVKSEIELKEMYDINYFLPRLFYEYLMKEACNTYWLQIGTAFEYDLSIIGGITETHPCVPQTHYGISKLQFSNYLLSKANNSTYSILRPFGMFGKYEDGSKFFPMLIKAQKFKNPVELSHGNQERDYFLIDDLVFFISEILDSNKLKDLPNILNLGSGKSYSFKFMANYIADKIPNFDSTLWEWGKLPLRLGESTQFFNSSSLAETLGFKISSLEVGFEEIVKYYYTS
ncbi:MAG TPA: NAD(P)-dependent oxidoreductase [Saprospiraceae bacterium]|nr:NAD(P)-dependent oxidoreductase [Saprospiraceae bacterium]